jgi:hypothetical protein
MKSVLNYIEEERTFYDTRTIPLSEGDEYSQKELIKTVNYARRSKYLEEASDEIIGDYPYDNISKYRVRLEARATDFDPKHIEVEPKNGSRIARVSAMIATKALQRHMHETDFAAYLNKVADTRPEYGGVLVKRTADGVHVVPWENVITDMGDILGGVIIERHYMRPSELKKTKWKNVNDVIKWAAEKKKSKDLDNSSGNDAETISHLIEIWELHGEVPKSTYEQALAEFEGKEYVPEAEDDTEYVEVQIIVAPYGKNEAGDMDGAILQVNEETEFPYDYDARNPLTGRGLGEGIPEELGEHQRWHNFYKTEEARAIAIGGKVLFVTDDGDVVDSVYDDGIDHGTILKVKEGGMFQQLSTNAAGVPVFQNIRAEWDASADKNTSSFSAVLGEEPDPGTPFKAQYLQDVNGSSQFLQEREKIGGFHRRVIEKWQLPDALDKIAKEEELYETFSPAELQMIDEVIIAEELLKAETRILLEEKRPVSAEEQEALRIGIELQLQRAGNKRSIDGIKDFIKKEVLGNVVIHTNDEYRSKAILFESYSNALALFAENDPARLAIRDRILDQMGVTKEELALYAEEAMAMATPANPELESEALAAEESVAA